MSASYVAGSGLALVAPGCALVLAGSDEALAQRCWPLVQRAAPIGEFVAVLTRDGFGGLGDFALLRAGTDGGPAVALVRGRARIAPTRDGVAGAVITGGTATTWIETELVADSARLLVGAEPSTGSRPIVEGVVSADAVDLPLAPRVEQAVEPTAEPRVDLAAVVSPPTAAPSPTTAQSPAAPPLPAATESGTAESPGTLIDGTPWSAVAHPLPPRSDVPTAAPPSMVEPDPAATAATRTDPGYPPGRPPPVGMEAGAAWSGPPVHAVVCPYGHLSAPYATTCRVCGTPVAAQEPILTARPLLGVLRLSTGDVVPLDRGVLLGRNPRPGADDDPARPHVLALPSPNKDLSRSHAEVRLEDWTVLVTDLGSTNGTTVAVPGHAPVRLRPHEPMPIEANTEVNMADEVVFRFEVSQ